MLRKNRRIPVFGILAARCLLIPAFLAIAAEPAGKAVSPVFGIAVPEGYRNWR